jgi:outer membrane protein assembly factor BamD (BamD/ComL family)
MAEKKQRNQVGSIASFDQPTGVGASNWYFSNPSAVGAGRTSFRQIWGQRTLEDHWRRTVKQSVTSNEEKVSDEKNDSVAEDNKVEVSRDESIMIAAEKMYSQLPLSEDEQLKAHQALEAAYYNIGKIYYFDLFEKKNAISAFTSLHEDYPESEYTAETYYLLYLIYKELENAEKSQAVSDYMHDSMPNSIYTKLIDNPKYEELSSQANEVLSKEYKNIYALFIANHLDSADQMISELLALYPDVTFSANLRLLQILLIGKTKPLADYQLALQSFIENYPDHELNPYAKELLESSSTYLDNLVKLKAAEYFLSSTEEYFFVVLSLINESGKLNEEILTPILNSNFKEEKLKVGSLALNDSINMTIVQSFRDKEDALLFFDTTRAEQLFDESKKSSFVISKSNFDILYKSKEIDAYMEFFREHF